MAPIQGLVSVAAVAFVFAVVLTPAAGWLAVLFGWLDRPDGRRKLHRRPVPKVGGVGVLAAFAIAGFLSKHPATVHAEEAGRFFALWTPLITAALFLTLVGLLDDVRGLRPVAKLLAQTIASSWLFLHGFRIERVTNPFGGILELDLLAFPLTVVWLVGLSNAWNLVDGVDGLAASLALVATCGILAAAVFNGRWEAAAVACALAGALLGFVPYNFHPARIFLGDCGALPVGMILGAIAVRSSIKASAAVAVAVPLLALALPILDVALAVVRRFVRRRPVFLADHDHIHHRLLDLGLSPRRAVLALTAVGGLLAALAFAITAGSRPVGWAVLVLLTLLLGIGVRALGYWEVAELRKSWSSRLLAPLRASGDAALRGLELDLEHAGSLEDAWQRACETAWQLGFDELHLRPRPAGAFTCPRLRSGAPRRPAALRGTPSAVADWTIEVRTKGVLLAEIKARRTLSAMDFDPRRLADLLRALVVRHCVGEQRETPPRPAAPRFVSPAPVSADLE